MTELPTASRIPPQVVLLALFKQIKLGAYSPDKDTDTGYFDVIGSDRRYVVSIIGIYQGC